MHDITSAKPMLKGLLFGSAAWEAVFVHQAHLAASVASGCDQQRSNSLHLQHLRRTLSNVGSIEPVGLRQISRRAIELR